MKKKISESIQIKTFLSMLALLIVSCVLIYGVVLFFLPRNYHAELQSQVTADFCELVEIIEQNGWEPSTNSILEFALKNNASVEITDGAGESVFSVNSVNLAGTGNAALTTDSTPSMSCSSTFRDNGQDTRSRVNIVLIAVSQSHGILLQLLPLIAGIILVVSVLGAAICSRYYSKPLVNISNVAKRMTTLDMTWKCEVNRKDEVGVLAASLNEMSRRLSDALDSLKAANWKLQKDIEREREQEKQRVEFFTAVSHELTLDRVFIKGQLEGMIYQVGEYKNRDTYLSRCLKTTNDMEALVKEILSAARMGSSDFHLERTDLDISQMLRKVCRHFCGRMEDKQIELRMDIQPEYHYQGDRRLMEKVFTNVIGNAVAYSPVGAVITVTQKKEVLSVENTGVHIAEEDLARIFTPFYRADKSRNRNSGGSGLGLYITRTILDHHEIPHDMVNTENGVKFTAFLW